MRALPAWVKGIVYGFLCIFTLAQTGFGQGPAAASAYGKLPLSFEPNQGQTAGEAQFLSRGRGYTLFLSSSDSVLALHRRHRGSRAERMEAGPSADAPAALRMHLVGANRSAQGVAEDALPGKSNYFIGNDRTKWRTDVPNYGRVRYRGVYPGIDLVYYGNQRLLEHDFVVAPGADPRRIRLAFDGIQRAEVEKSGDLSIASRRWRSAPAETGHLPEHGRGPPRSYRRICAAQESGHDSGWFVRPPPGAAD